LLSPLVQQWKETRKELAQKWSIIFTRSDLIKRESAVLHKRIDDGLAEDELDVSSTLEQLQRDNPAARVAVDAETLAAMMVDDIAVDQTAGAAAGAAAAGAAAATVAVGAPIRKRQLSLPSTTPLSGSPLEVATVTALQSIAASVGKIASALSGVSAVNARAAAAVRIAMHRCGSMLIVLLDLTLYAVCWCAV
jgi:hypothetical protein